jgi:hypothetical protein
MGMPQFYAFSLIFLPVTGYYAEKCFLLSEDFESQ